jgi:hypothetical protein
MNFESDSAMLSFYKQILVFLAVAIISRAAPLDERYVHPTAPGMAVVTLQHV